MKKSLLLLITLLACLFVSSVQAETGYIRCPNIYSGAIAASGSVNGVPDLNFTTRAGYEGYFSIQPIFTGDGTLKIEYQVSNDGSTWSPAVTIIADAVSGTHYPYPGSGTNVFAGYQRIVLTETSTTDTLSVTGVYRCTQ